MVRFNKNSIFSCCIQPTGTLLPQFHNKLGLFESILLNELHQSSQDYHWNFVLTSTEIKIKLVAEQTTDIFFWQKRNYIQGEAL